MSAHRRRELFERVGAGLDRDRRVGTSFCATCVEVLDVAGAGVLLSDSGGVRAAWGVSDATMAEVEDIEHVLGEGPCVDAYTSGEVISVPDLTAPGVGPWVRYIADAVAAGVRSVFGFPIGIAGERLGSLNVYDTRPGPLGDDRCADALLLADIATVLVLAEAGADTDILVAELADVGRHQTQIHQATGMVSVQAGVPVSDALALLRARAFSAGRPLSAVAAEVVERRLRFDP